jgi:hypothetical protein
MTGWRGLLIGAALVVTACGGGDHDRDDKVCRSCDAGVDRECFDECQDLCVDDDPNCATRCAAQCDDCRRDLVCGACVGDCTGSLLRCAPSNETVSCEDGTFGGVPATPPD